MEAISALEHDLMREEMVLVEQLDVSLGKGCWV